MGLYLLKRHTFYLLVKLGFLTLVACSNSPSISSEIVDTSQSSSREEASKELMKARNPSEISNALQKAGINFEIQKIGSGKGLISYFAKGNLSKSETDDQFILDEENKFSELAIIIGDLEFLELLNSKKIKTLKVLNPYGYLFGNNEAHVHARANKQEVGAQLDVSLTVSQNQLLKAVTSFSPDEAELNNLTTKEVSQKTLSDYIN